MLSDALNTKLDLKDTALFKSNGSEIIDELGPDFDDTLLKTKTESTENLVQPNIDSGRFFI